MRHYDIELDSNISDNFSDSNNNYYSPFVATAKRLGFVTGVSNNRFLPGNNITRQDMFVIIYRIMDKLGQLPPIDENNGNKFEDYEDIDQIGSHAVEAIKHFVESGTIKGRNGKIVPRGYARRAEAAQVLYNIVKMK